MANKYTLGNSVVLTLVAKKLTDPFGPTYDFYDILVPTLVVQRTAPDVGPPITYTYPASPEIAKPNGTTGEYYATLSPDTVGTWRYKWIDPASITPGLVEGSFVITAARL